MTPRKKLETQGTTPISPDAPRGGIPGAGVASTNQGEAAVRTRGFGDTGSNAGEVDPGIGSGGDTVGEIPAGAGGGAGFGNAIGGGDDGDVPESANEPEG